MANAFHRDNQTTQDKTIAALACYLGYPLERVEVALDGTATYTVRCPMFDWQDVLKEAQDESTPVCFKPFVEKLGWVIGKMTAAKRNGGVYQRVG